MGILSWKIGVPDSQSVQSLHRVRLFVTPWTASRQASLSVTNPWSLLKLMSMSWWCHLTISSSVVPFSSCLQSFPASESFPMSQFFASCGQSIGASASVLPMNIQDQSPLGFTGLIPLQSKGLSSVFSSTILRRQFFGTQPFFYHPALTFVCDCWINHSFD